MLVFTSYDFSSNAQFIRQKIYLQEKLIADAQQVIGGHFKKLGKLDDIAGLRLVRTEFPIIDGFLTDSYLSGKLTLGEILFFSQFFYSFAYHSEKYCIKNIVKALDKEENFLYNVYREKTA